MLSDPTKAAAGGVSPGTCAVATYEGATVVAGGDAPELDANAGPILLGAAKGGIAKF